MKCNNCGHEVKNTLLYCPVCNEPVQIVPDYNPLEDVLAAQIKVGINDNEDMEPPRPPKRELSDREKRRRMEIRRAQRRKRKLTVLSILGVILALIIGTIIFLYQNSYAGQIGKGNRLLKEQEYKKAEEPFRNALSKNDTKNSAYIGLSKAYIGQNDLGSAEKMFEDAILKYPQNVPIYEAFLDFYLDTKQEEKISELLEKCDPEILSDLKQYISERPVFSLAEDAIFDEVQELSLKSDYDIYYTTDDTKPTTSSLKYKEPLLLHEGQNIIRAISVNPKGIPSLEVKKVYTIEFPVQDAPAVVPSTGQYDVDMMIEVTVPEGYTAYYTTDNTMPSAASKKYNGPIAMPEGNTLFSVILIDARGRLSNVTKRNYELIKE